MPYELSIARLKANLLRAGDETGRFPSPTDGMTIGERYLYEHFLLPLIAERPLTTNELDWDAFTPDDVRELYWYYHDQMTDSSPTVQRLTTFIRKTRAAVPLSAKAIFI